MPLPDAVIFDADGLLVDTETCDYESWRELHASHGLELSLEEFCYTAGLYGCWERLYAELSEKCGVHWETLRDLREPRFRELVQAQLTPTPELLDLIGLLRHAGIPRGIASSSDSDWVAHLVDGLGLRHEFRAIATGHDVERRKPAPDVYLLAARRLDADPRRCVALEDSAHGIAAAQAAGMRVIVVPNPVSRLQDLTAADAEVRHLGEITLDLLCALGGAPLLLF